MLPPWMKRDLHKQDPDQQLTSLNWRQMDKIIRYSSLNFVDIVHDFLACGLDSFCCLPILFMDDTPLCLFNDVILSTKKREKRIIRCLLIFFIRDHTLFISITHKLYVQYA